MAKEQKKKSGAAKKQPAVKHKEKKAGSTVAKDREHLLALAVAPGPGQEYHWFQTTVIILFTSVVSMIVRMAVYSRPMEQFYWNDSGNTLTDFFGYWKMSFIIMAAVLAVMILVYRTVTQTLTIKRNAVYIPMMVYSLCVLLSYVMSDYKAFAFTGFKERFEGLVTLLCYMVILFYIINTLRSERSVKQVVWGAGVCSGLLGILGLFQSLGMDLFRSALGLLLIIPGSHAYMRETMNYNFAGQEIYQTLFNHNYVSFYLTLLLPLFGMLFIHEKDKLRKTGLGALFTLLVYNLIGSESSGGVLGLAAAGLVAVVMLNKRILQWWKPVVVLLALAVAMAGINVNRILPEMESAISGVAGSGARTVQQSAGGRARPAVDYMETGYDTITISINGEPFVIRIGDAFDGTSVEGLTVTDGRGAELPLAVSDEDEEIWEIQDDRFRSFAFLATEADGENRYVFVNMPEQQWSFVNIPDMGTYYVNVLGKLVILKPAAHSGFADSQNFGSGRGYIWSRTIPMVKDTLLIGHGPETYVIYFPNYDYAGKYTAGWNPNTIVDKPHNMYLGTAVNTGGISLLALLALYGIYTIQSVRLYLRRKYEGDFLAFCGAGIFFGICGFLVAGLVNDSTVNVTSMFYGLLGTGLAVNAMIADQDRKAMKTEE